MGQDTEASRMTLGVVFGQHSFHMIQQQGGLLLVDGPVIIARLIRGAPKCS
jgi:hypothetical protein